MYEHAEIRRTGGEPFGTKGSLAASLEQKKLTESHDMVEKEGGWVGVKKEIGKKKLIKCRVYRANCDPDNKDQPISVTINTASSKRNFWPGEIVELSKSHIGVLKDSVEETKLQIPPESGVYASSDPIAVARNFYPTMTAVVNPTDNMITMISRVPNYIVEMVG